MHTIKFDMFPGGNHHCITLSYDDGKEYDIRLAQLLRENGLVGTFHLNASRLGTSNFVKADQLKEIYAGHEISCHMSTHPFPTDIPSISVLQEILEERKVLEAACGYVVRGMSYPFGNYDERVISLLRAAGMEYSRTTASTRNFNLPQDFMKWHPSCHHKDNLLDRLNSFYGPDRHNRMRLLYVWGHSYEFNTDNNWEIIEEFARAAAHRPDTWYASNIAIVEYMNALHSLRISADRGTVYNPTATAVWFTADGETVSLAPGASVSL